ncbi:DEAD/DEAH box helicase [Pseudomonas oryzihabitans]|uniref:DEAD/DEAH box helicase n=1 Tax=Pseudomonas oryzihabitans TaxID=47885 RepID=UPI0011A9D1CF|nr:DEAD/DEAH box helicase family protein [Pseudomonas psychrotolerans]
MKELRGWQQACIAAAMEHYRSSAHFFCQATPGSGKSRMAAELAKEMLQAGLIELVLCFAPSRQVVDGLEKTFSKVLGRPFNGQLGSVGAASTYQAMDYRSSAFWKLVEDYRVLVIFDEVHHCAGHDPLLSNAWGQIILQRIQDKAAYTLALSGTPWRSDERAIVLARYSSPEGRLVCDFNYGLREAVTDRVCRTPRIAVLENNAIRLTEQSDSVPIVTTHSSIAQLLNESPISFESILGHPELIGKILSLGQSRLDDVRKDVPNAGGLIVATNIRHANQIAATLRQRGEDFVVVTNRTPSAHQVIEGFRKGTGRWIVAVGMISEGTDIPRLQVCCYLSRIRTELHYRQVLGRILRRTGNEDHHAWLYILAEPSLIQFSQRIAQDLPEDLAVLENFQILKGSDGSLDNLYQDTHEPSFECLEFEIEQRLSAVEELDAAFGEDSLFKIELSKDFRTEILSLY